MRLDISVALILVTLCISGAKPEDVYGNVGIYVGMIRVLDFHSPDADIGMQYGVDYQDLYAGLDVAWINFFYSSALAPADKPYGDIGIANVAFNVGKSHTYGNLYASARVGAGYVIPGEKFSFNFPISIELVRQFKMIGFGLRPYCEVFPFDKHLLLLGLNGVLNIKVHR